MFDEAHAAHIRGEVVDFVRALGGNLAVFLEIQIELQILDVREALVPLAGRLSVHGADVLVTLFAKPSDQMATDKSTCAGN